MQNDSQNQIVSAIIIAGIIIAGAILLKDSQPRETLPNQAIATNDDNNLKNMDFKPITDEDHILGNKNARIIIMEYSDTECPFCRIFHETMQKIMEQNSDVAWVYRHYPIPKLHSKALREAEATECAFEQGGNIAFWNYIDRLFAITPSNNGLEEEELINIAQYIGLNTSSFYTCLESGKYKNKVEKDIADGIKIGVNEKGTPYSLILTNGKVADEIRGAQPYELIIQQLDAIK